MPAYLSRDGFLLVEVSEPYTLNLFLSIIHQAAGCYSTNGLRKVLTNFSQANGNPGTMDRYTLNLVMENVAVNRGANVKAFSQRTDALIWLGIDSANEQTQT